jgi:glucokinase
LGAKKVLWRAAEVHHDPGILALGIDLGGSKILTAVVDAQGRMLSRDYRLTPAAQGPDPVVEAILQSSGQALDQAGLSRDGVAVFGIGAPGISNPETGVVFTSPNLPGWHNVPLGKTIERRSGKPTFLVNDANAAAIGELHFGAGKDARNFIYVTVSTGIGGGIIIDGQLYSGSTGTAGEIGHMAIVSGGPRCNCGNTGCWETLASGSALAREALRRIGEGTPTSILGYVDGDVRKVTAKVIHAAAERNDRLARELIGQTAYYLGVGLANLINIFNPELVVIGGGLSNMGDILLKPAFQVASKRAFSQACKTARFARATLGGNSGVLGAAAFALAELKRQRQP